MRRGRERGMGANLKHTREITRYYAVISPQAKELLLTTPNRVFVIVRALLTATVHVQEPASTIPSKLNHLSSYSFQFRLPPSNMPQQVNGGLTMYTRGHGSVSLVKL